MKERPILMTPENAQKCFDGVKTQTRRIIKPQPSDRAILPREWSDVMRLRKDKDIYGTDGLTLGNVPMADGSWGVVRCHFGTIGDRLYVKEGLEESPCGNRVQYRRDRAVIPGHSWHWERSTLSPMHMPKWAARLWLEIVEVRVERLKDISENDAKAEGVKTVREFAALWESINGEVSWDENPWVWVIAFRKVGS